MTYLELPTFEDWPHPDSQLTKAKMEGLNTALRSLESSTPMSLSSINSQVGTGDEDIDTATFNTALALPNQRIHVPAPAYGKYLVRSMTGTHITHAVNITGDGPDRSIIELRADARQIDVRHPTMGTDNTNLTGGVALTANLAVGGFTATVGVGNTSTFIPGNWVWLLSQAIWPGLKGAWTGEEQKILSVDAAAGTVTFVGPVEETYNVADTAKLYPRSTLPVSRISGLSFVNNSFSTAVQNLMWFQNAPVIIEDVQTHNLCQSAVVMNCTSDWYVRSLYCFDSKDNEGLSQFGYGILAQGFSTGGIAHDLRMYGGRHPFTTGGNVGQGVPRHHLIADSYAYGVHAAWGGHEEGRYITFANCKARACDAHAFDARAPDTTFINPQVSGGDPGIYIPNTGHRARVIGGCVERTRPQFWGTAYGIWINGADDVWIGGGFRTRNTQGHAIHVEGTANRCTIADAFLDLVAESAGVGTGTCILIENGDGHTIDGVTVRRANIGFQVNSAVTNLREGVVNTDSTVTTTRVVNSATTYRKPPELSGSGTPEGNLTAPAGSGYRRLTPSAVGDELYVKKSGTGNTGWRRVGDRYGTVGNVDMSWDPVADANIIKLITPLTANRAITTASTLVVTDKLRVTRPSTVTGAFTMSVMGVSTLDPGKWVEVTYDGAGWYVSAFGATS
jgi:hypothetical protein